jgi:hypothetical protein
MKHFPESENKILIYSSLSFLLISPFLGSQNIVVGLLGILAILHHILPKNLYIRILDWSLSIYLVYFVVNKAYASSNEILWSIGLVSLIIWLTSIYMFHVKKSDKFYTITHLLWHITAAITIYITLS